MTIGEKTQYFSMLPASLIVSFAFARKNEVLDNNTSKHAKAALTSFHVNNLKRDSPDYFLHLQRTIGNQAVQRLVRSENGGIKGFDFAKIGIQPKLKISQPGDDYEQEADRVAEQVMRMIGPDGMTKRETLVDSKCDACKIRKEEMKISRKPST